MTTSELVHLNNNIRLLKIAQTPIKDFTFKQIYIKVSRNKYNFDQEYINKPILKTVVHYE
jgi:hypothetical protein